MKKSTSFVFTGDIAFDKYMDGKWEDEELIHDEVLSFLHSGDHVVVDVEGPVSDYEQDPTATGMSALFHTIDPAALRLFSRIHADIWDINNNHMMDIGEKGLLDTLTNAKKAGVCTIGAGRNIEEAAKPLFFPEAGGIGLFAVGFPGKRHGCQPAGPDKAGCLQWDKTEIIQKNIKEIKSRCRWCVIVSHGGEEFASLPAPYVRDRYLSFLDMGADLVVGHHPHVPHNYETFPGKAIFYSLGNFIFDTDYQRAQYNTERGIVLKITFTEDDFTFEPMGTVIQRPGERIVRGDVPAIFEDIREEEYEKLYPLAAKMYFEAVKRQYRFLIPGKYDNAPEEEWEKRFTNPEMAERNPMENMDLPFIYAFAQKEKEGAWKESRLDKVREYILSQMAPMDARDQSGSGGNEA